MLFVALPRLLLITHHCRFSSFGIELCVVVVYKHIDVIHPSLGRTHVDFAISPEFAPILDALKKCLELRDKYTLVSGQRLGFNPKDYDGLFTGLRDEASDVGGVRPDAPKSLVDGHPIESSFTPWRIYPRPPPPHWHWTDHSIAGPSHSTTPGDEEFVFGDCVIPGEDSWGFEIDEKGVYQVYENVDGKDSHLCSVPRLGNLR